MAGSKIEKLIEQIALPVAENLGYELVDVEYVKEGPHYYLRIYIDKSGGVSIDDCQIMNDVVEPLIDKEDPILGAYFLEISSPGIDRPLKTEKDFEKCIGKEVEVSLYEAVDGSKHFEGELIGKDADSITIKIKEKNKEKEMNFSKEKVSVIKRTIKF